MAKQKEINGLKRVKMQSKRDGRIHWVHPDHVAEYERAGHKRLK